MRSQYLTSFTILLSISIFFCCLEVSQQGTQNMPIKNIQLTQKCQLTRWYYIIICIWVQSNQPKQLRTRLRGIFEFWTGCDHFDRATKSARTNQANVGRVILHQTRKNRRHEIIYRVSFYIFWNQSWFTNQTHLCTRVPKIRQKQQQVANIFGQVLSHVNVVHSCVLGICRRYWCSLCCARLAHVPASMCSN